MYNHFAYTLIFAILVAVGFMLWMFVEVNFPRHQCLQVSRFPRRGPLQDFRGAFYLDHNMYGLKFDIFFLSLSISSNQQDWQEVWLRDCFWHFLFCFILVVIMIIWRPSSNSSRFAYSLVNDLDPEDEEEEKEMENKNFGKTCQGVHSEFLSLGGM